MTDHHPAPPAGPPASRRRWPLLVIGASAGTATWSGWVGLGELTGFGVVHPLPGIWDDLTINSAITLPVGVEAYAVYALAVATDHRTRTTRVRRWAWASAFGALLLGMAGQIAYHLLTPNARPGTPDWIVALVSCLPVLVLGAASLLWHLTGHDHDPAAGRPVDSGRGVNVAVLPDDAPVRPGDEDSGSRAVPSRPAPAAVLPPSGPSSRPDRQDRSDSAGRSRQAAGPRVGRSDGPGREQEDGRAVGEDAQIVAAIVRSGLVPTVRQIKAEFRVGGSRAVRLRALALEALDTATPAPATSDTVTGRSGLAAPAAAGAASSPTAHEQDVDPRATAAGAVPEADHTGDTRDQVPESSPLQAEIEEFLQRIERREHPDE